MNQIAEPKPDQPVETWAETSSLQIENPAVEIEKLNLFYGKQQALFDVDMKIPDKDVTAFIGPSGCGKSTLLRCFNRMNDLIDIVNIDGTVNVKGENIYEVVHAIETPQQGR